MKEKQAIGLMVNKYIKIPKSYKPLIKDIDTSIGQLSLGIADTYKWFVENGHLSEKDALLTFDKVLENLGKYGRTAYFDISK